MRRVFVPVMVGAFFCVAGCGHGHLVPADAAKLVPGTDAAAYTVVDGVRCTAESSAWEGRPGDLPSSVAPMKVRIRNDSDRPVRVRYQDFALLGSSGRRYHPLPLVPRQHETGVTIDPLYAADKFFVAPLLHDVYPDLPAWSKPLPRDEALYDEAYARWGAVRPDRHVLREGMPEGMLEAGGSVTGFLYFESPVPHEGHAVFQAELERGGDSAGQITTIEIPFRVD